MPVTWQVDPRRYKVQPRTEVQAGTQWLGKDGTGLESSRKWVRRSSLVYRKRRCPVARAGTQVYRDPRSQHFYESPEGQTRLPSFCRGLRRDKDKGGGNTDPKLAVGASAGRGLGIRFKHPLT